MKEMYSMKEVVFMYLKASIKKQEWETFRTLETAPTDEFREEYKRLMPIMKRIVFMLTASEECVEIFQDKNLMLNSEEVKAIAGLLYQFETNDIWIDIEELLPLYSAKEKDNKSNKKRRPKGTEWRTAIRKIYGLNCLPRKTRRDIDNEIYKVLENNEKEREKLKNNKEEREKLGNNIEEQEKSENSTEKQEDNDICIKERRELPFDEMYSEIYTAANLLETVLSHRVKNAKELIDNATGRKLSFVKGTWKIEDDVKDE